MTISPEPVDGSPPPDDICTCGHTFSTHEPLYESLAYLKHDEPCAYRCTVSDGCMDFTLTGPHLDRNQEDTMNEQSSQRCGCPDPDPLGLCYVPDCPDDRLRFEYFCFAHIGDHGTEYGSGGSIDPAPDA